MPEYIKREAATDICDRYYQHCLTMHNFFADSVVYDINEDIKKLPAADVVEVVRCKKCEHYNTSCCADGFGWCEKHNRGEMDDHFCSHGERRSDNG